jgi:hypothetical protein
VLNTLVTLVAKPAPPNDKRIVMKQDLLNATDLALANQWVAAHEIVQQHEGDSTAAWIHAVLHKIEGDESNSRYWYRRAGKLEHASDEPRAELEAIRKACPD